MHQFFDIKKLDSKATIKFLRVPKDIDEIAMTNLRLSYLAVEQDLLRIYIRGEEAQFRRRVIKLLRLRQDQITAIVESHKNNV